ncbi:MAG: glycosyltransferase, partial [Myxococcota bacterium]
MPPTLDTVIEQSKQSGLPRICMISTHGYVAADPPLGAADTGGQVVYVLELSKKLAELGYEVDIWTRRFEDQPEVDVVDEHVRVVRVPCGGREFIPKEYLYKKLGQWCENALRIIVRHKLDYQFINSHYWDAGYAGDRLSNELDVIHIHTPHSLGEWKRRRMAQDFPDDAATFEQEYNFTERIRHETNIIRECDLVVATTPVQTDELLEHYDASKGRIRVI